MGDDLRQPLRRRRLRDNFRLPRPTPLAAATVLLAAGLVGLGSWLHANPDPWGGEPVVHALIEAADPIATGKTEAPPPAEEETESAADGMEIEPAPEDVAADHEQADDSVQVSRTRAQPLAPAPLKALSEKGPFGQLPRIAANGRKPWQAYAKPVPSDVLRSDTPKIAVVLGGMGLNDALTRRAIRELPAGVTLAFAPYGSGLQTLVNEARGSGHEVMLHLPMEPFGYPNIDPGPKTLVASAPPAETRENLLWLMSRFSGYTGILNYMGARFTAERGALEPVVTELGRRGLVYLDDSSSARSLAAELGGPAKLPVRRAEQAISGDSFQSALDDLRRLEEQARSSGLAIGVGSGLSVTIEAVQAWSREAADRGILIVPVSASFRAGSG
ncbi:MAG: divergent polysaccharide deacetylase family protein [Parvibaculaceae bacterium]